MLLKSVGNIITGKTPTGENVRIVSDGKKILTQVGETLRERTVKSVPITEEAETLREAFPQYNDFKLIIRHDKYSGNKRGTRDKGCLVGVKGDGKETVLMRQDKVNSGFSDISLNYDTNQSVSINPNDLETFKSKIRIYKPSDFQIRPTLYTEVTDEFAKSYLQSMGKLR